MAGRKTMGGVREYLTERECAAAVVMTKYMCDVWLLVAIRSESVFMMWTGNPLDSSNIWKIMRLLKETIMVKKVFLCKIMVSVSEDISRCSRYTDRNVQTMNRYPHVLH